MPISQTAILQALGCTLTFGRLIAEQREKSELTQAVFAEKLGISTSKLSNIENAKAKVWPDEAAEFARILGQDEEQFVRLAIQEMLDIEHLNYTVNLEAKKI